MAGVHPHATARRPSGVLSCGAAALRLRTAGHQGAAAALLAVALAAGAVPLPAPSPPPAPSPSPSSSPALLTTPTTVVDRRGRAVILTAPPRRIVSLVPSLTETVCDLGACDRLVGTDRHSDWPARVRALPKLGGLDDAQVERIVALKPDLVLVAPASRAAGRLESLGIAVLVLQADTLADSRRMIGTLAAALGRTAEADALGRRIDARIAAAAARVPPAWRGRTVYLEVTTAPHAAGAASFPGELLARLGLVNVVPASLGPFPQLGGEFVVRARPDVVMAAADALTGMPARPGWGALPALRDGRTCGFAPGRFDLLVRPGPRLGEAAEAVADCLAALRPPGAAGAQAVRR